MPLFDGEELSAHLQYEVSDAAAASAERVVWGWLKGPLGLTERPNPVPDEVFSWAIELGAIAHENPAGLSEQTTGDETNRWALARRAEILDDARSSSAATSTTGPRGNFPRAHSWPDPARGCW